MTRIMTALAHELSIRGAIDVSEAFIDASFAPAKKGGAMSEKRNAAREQRSWRLQIVMGCQFQFAQRVPLPTKVGLAMSTLLQMVIPDVPQNSIGDNATTPTASTQN
jgi:hypothetical protein